MSPLNPLERAIEEIERLVSSIDGRRLDATNYITGFRLKPLDAIELNGVDKALSICQRILSESREEKCLGNPEWCGKEVKCGEVKQSEPAAKKWEIRICTKEEKTVIKIHLSEGFEPFAVDRGVIYFKRLVPCEKEVISEKCIYCNCLKNPTGMQGRDGSCKCYCH